MNLWTKYLKEKSKDLQITVSVSKEPHIINKLINILITVQNAERSINNNNKNKKNNIENTNTKHPKQLNTERKKKPLGEKKKNRNPYLCSKSEKQSSLARRKKLPFVNFQSNFLAPSPL